MPVDPMTGKDALSVAEASLRRTHPTRHDVGECDGCAVIAIIDALRADVAELQVLLNNATKLAECAGDLRARVAELETREQTQYRIVPHEEPCEATWNRPWHSPRCYEGGAHISEDRCTCGLTALRAESRDLRTATDAAINHLENGCPNTQALAELRKVKRT